MKYNPPLNSTDPDAPYLDAIPGQREGSVVGAASIEYAQREIVNAIIAAGFEPTNDNLAQLFDVIRKEASPSSAGAVKAGGLPGQIYGTSEDGISYIFGDPAEFGIIKESDFTSVFDSSSGWANFPRGLQVRWTRISIPSIDGVLTGDYSWPSAFSTACGAISVSLQAASPLTLAAHAWPLSATQFRVTFQSSGAFGGFTAYIIGVGF